jgi:hypothetical protein
MSLFHGYAQCPPVGLPNDGQLPAVVAVCGQRHLHDRRRGARHARDIQHHAPRVPARRQVCLHAAGWVALGDVYRVRVCLVGRWCSL